MRITDLLKSESIALGQKPADKQSAIRQLADLMAASGNLSDKEQYLKDVFAREASGTTGLGDGIATPHAKSTGVKEAGLAAMTVPEGMDFESMDGNPARLFFMIAAPNSANDAHIQILQQLAMMIMDPDFKEALIAAKTKEEFLHLIDLKEDGKFEAPKAEAAEGDSAAAEEKPASDHIQVLAVTACPTGIAHTFMAAESLEQHAKKHGIPIATENKTYSMDRNIWHLSHEGSDLEDPANEPHNSMFLISKAPEDAKDEPEYVTVDFEKGEPVAVNGKKMDPVALLTELNEIGARNGVGIVDICENRLVGMKSRGVYENPGGSILYYAHRELEYLCLDRMTYHFKQHVAVRFGELVYDGMWFCQLREALSAFVDSTQQTVTGTVKLKLYKGNIISAGSTSPYSLYSKEYVTFEHDDVYNQADATGFINLFGLPLKVRALMQEKNSK